LASQEKISEVTYLTLSMLFPIYRNLLLLANFSDSVTNYMVFSRHSEANSISAGQEHTCLSWNLQDPYCNHKIPL